MNEKKVYIFTGIFTVVLVVLGLVLVNKSQPTSTPVQADSGANAEVVGETSFDWGQIDIEGGVVDRTFEIKNSGTSDLIVSNIKTSCACTEAIVSINGADSPPFGMHTRSNWKGTVKPGDVASFRVVFDPMFHGPQGTGPISRIVSVSTNDPENRTLEYTLTGNVFRK